MERSSKVFVRFVLTAMCGIATFYFAFWTISVITRAFGMPLAMLTAMIAMFVVWHYSAKADPGLFSSAVLGAVVTGGIGFSAGFFGPILFMPHANQGPLLGIFITGPAGFLLGGISGLIVALVRRRRPTDAGHPTS